MSNPSPATRLILTFTLGPALTPASVRARAAAADVAAVVLRPDGAADAAARLRAVAAAVQPLDIAVLVADRPDLVAAAGLDGAHVSAPPAVAAALKALKPAAIVGAGGLASRHDAMVAGESGVDYVAFGALDGAADDLPRILDLVAWWSALFEVPCVAVAPTLDAVSDLAAAGADFVLLPAALSAGGPEAVAAAGARIAALGGTEQAP